MRAKSHFLFIQADLLAAKALAAYGNTVAKTPPSKLLSAILCGLPMLDVGTVMADKLQRIPFRIAEEERLGVHMREGLFMNR